MHGLKQIMVMVFMFLFWLTLDKVEFVYDKVYDKLEWVGCVETDLGWESSSNLPS